MLWRILLTVGFNPRVAVRRTHDPVRYHFHFLLRLRIVEFSPDQTLCSEERVRWIGHGLALGWCADEKLSLGVECYD